MKTEICCIFCKDNTGLSKPESASQICSCGITAPEVFLQRKNYSDFHHLTVYSAITGMDCLSYSITYSYAFLSKHEHDSDTHGLYWMHLL